jgi:two-component system, response regulator PdtaR
MAGWRERRKLERDLTRTRERLAAQRVLSQAKGLLMAAEPGMTEAQAFRRIQILSMNVRKTIPEGARPS